MNIGIFSGSFDPIHVGHIILANYITEFTEIDEVWFLVSPQNPLKDSKTATNEAIRLDMLRKALDRFPKFVASDFEFKLERPSYTINTLRALQDAYPDNRFSLIIGADNWAVFEAWKDYEDIIRDFNIMVYPRLGSRISIPPKMRQKVEALESPIIEVSSTFIRDGIAAGKDMRAFIPNEIADYINEEGLYK